MSTNQETSPLICRIFLSVPILTMMPTATPSSLRRSSSIINRVAAGHSNVLDRSHITLVNNGPCWAQCCRSPWIGCYWPPWSLWVAVWGQIRQWRVTPMLMTTSSNWSQNSRRWRRHLLWLIRLTIETIYWGLRTLLIWGNWLSPVVSRPWAPSAPVIVILWLWTIPSVWIPLLRHQFPSLKSCTMWHMLGGQQW